MNNWVQQFGLGLGAAALMMFVLWIVQRRTNNAGIVDVGWAVGIGALTLAFALSASGAAHRRIVVAAMTTIWSARLAQHLIRRISSEPEDGRYQNLRNWAGERQQVVLFVFFMLQATWVLIFAVPQYIAMQNVRAFGGFDIAAILIFMISLIGEFIADRQLAAFRRSPANAGEVCQVGLWRYSRHPNYFFELLHWFAYPLMAIGIGRAAWLALIGPSFMLLFLLKITGIPPTEKRALQSRGDRYRAYQRTTSAFIPWFPREQGS